MFRLWGDWVLAPHVSWTLSLYCVPGLRVHGIIMTKHQHGRKVSANCRLSSADADAAADVRMHCLKRSAWLVEVVKSGDKYAGLSGQEKKGRHRGRQHNHSVGGRWMSAWVADAEMGSCLLPAPALTRIVYYVRAAGKVLHAFCASLCWASVVMLEWVWWCGVGGGYSFWVAVGCCRCKYKCLSADSSKTKRSKSSTPPTHTHTLHK